MMESHFYKTWTQAEGLPETYAKLERLPLGLHFHEEFPEPIRYDARHKMLVYRGFMSSGSYRFLHSLSTDSAYLIALDVLYQASAFTVDVQSPGRVWPWLVGVGMGCLGGSTAVAWTLLR